MTHWLIDTLLTTGALIALVLILRRPVARAFGPGMAYALWALPLVRLLLPPLVLPASFAPKADAPATVAVTQAAAQLPAAPAAIQPLVSLPQLLLALWLAGAALYLAWRIVSYRAMRRRLLADARPMGEVGKVRLVESPALPAPVAFGIFDKVVALPMGFMASPDRAARDLAIAHELEHHAGHDLAANFAVQPLLALHWFNPLAWAAWRAMRRDQEAACDARVMAGRDGETRAAYGRLIASFAGGPRLSLAAPMAEPLYFGPMIGEKSIIHRLRSLAMNEPTPRRRMLGRALLGASALALPLTASISYASSAPDAPPPPAAAASPAAPEAPKVQKRIIVVEHRHGGDADQAAMRTRTITRDGKSITVTSDSELSDADLEAKLAQIDKDLPAEIDAAAGEDKPGERRERRVVIIHPGDGEAHETAMAGEPGSRRIVIRTTGDGHHAPHALALADGAAMACKDGPPALAVNTGESREGRRQIIRVRICNRAGGMAHALGGIRHARARIEADTNLSPSVKAQVLEQLDAEIARLSKTD